MTDDQLAAYIAELRTKGVEVSVGPRVLQPLAAIEPVTKKQPKRVKVNLLSDGFDPPPAGKLWPVTFTVGVQTASEANESHWQRRASRNGIIRKAVSRVLGRELAHLVPFAIAYHKGLPVRVHFIRLGGRKMDKLANLGTALKAAEDAVCLMLGADDGARNWLPSCDQQPGGAYGVRITLSIESNGLT